MNAGDRVTGDFAKELPATPGRLDAWVLAHRRNSSGRPTGSRLPVNWLVEPERTADGRIVPVLTVFLANRECPWRCVFCDLWRHTLEHTVGSGEIPAQIDAALAAVGQNSVVPSQIKLYNAGSFFDPRAILPSDHSGIALRVAGFERVIVECHPALVDGRVARFRDELVRSAGGRGPALEVAMGLETLNPAVLPRLNKRMTADDFAQAARRLVREGIDVRAFVLVQPPFEARGEAVDWTRRSAAFAFDAGAKVVSVIPTRLGNGVLDALREAGQFEPPTLETFEEAVDASLGVAGGRGRVFADLWDLEAFSRCPACLPARHDRLIELNNEQRLLPRYACPVCRSGSSD